MFWGISLEVGKRYSQTVEKSFHISMAALTASNDAKGPVTVMVEVEKACYPICTLQPGKIPQQALDYIFTEGEEVLFYTEGDLDVHLTGYLIDEPSPFEYSTDDDESASESNAASSDNEQANKKKKKRKKSDNESSEEEALETLISELDGLNEDNENVVDIWLQRSARKKQKNEITEHDSAAPVSSLTGILLDNGDSEGSEDDEWIPGGKRKLKKKQKAESGTKEKKTKQNIENCGSKKQDSDSNCSPSKLNTSKSKQKNSKKKSSDSKEDEEKLENGDKDVSHDSKINSEQNEVGDSREESASRRELPGGLIVEDMVKGEGKKAKKGRQVSVYYKGCLKKTMKEFDSCLKGTPFTFRLGQGEVIKGWDNGVEGMQIGGKRRLTVPPSLGYGSKEMDSSSIPPNSTLIFAVELLKVH